MADFDPFAFYRTLLFVFLGVYTLLTLTTGAMRLWDLLRGQSPGKRFLRLYLSYQLISVRLRAFWRELLQIGLLLGMLVTIAALHSMV